MTLIQILILIFFTDTTQFSQSIREVQEVQDDGQVKHFTSFLLCKYVDLCIINKMANINEQQYNNQEMHNMMQQVHFQYQNIPITYLTNQYYGQFYNKLQRFLFHHHWGLGPYQYQQIQQDMIQQ
ncbi:unnamed protein product [Paramecium primaurelia]|uniref:Transmembrane protein n=1 Tax=Paramecium primaurelia TaxID=5886 RepID=A0A8S1MU56_PARPR|nr:unnamed protein product [Paramecium primaurelia]